MSPWREILTAWKKGGRLRLGEESLGKASETEVLRSTFAG
jgi:hypothetical protein